MLADVPAPALYRDLVGLEAPAGRFLDDLAASSGTTPRSRSTGRSTPDAVDRPGARGAGTVHLGVDLDGFVDIAADLTVGRMPHARSCCSAR